MTQIERVYDLMSDGHWRTLSQIVGATGIPRASAAAHLRRMRQTPFQKRRPGTKVDVIREPGRANLHRYRVVVPS